MDTSKKILYVLLPSILLLGIVTQVLTFIGIGIESYAIYLVWLLASCLFYIILPSKQSIIEY